jgi:hypothetical protein
VTLQYVSSFVFTTSAQLLTKLHDTLVLSGWKSITNTPGSGLIRLSGQSYSDLCFLQVNSLTRGTKLAIELKGSLDSTFLTLSHTLPTAITQTTETTRTRLDLRYSNGANNQLFLTASPDAFVIAISDFNESQGAISCWRFGFYDRIEPFRDNFAWGLGPVHFGLYQNYVARRYIDNSLWFNLGNSYPLINARGDNTNYQPSNYYYFDQENAIQPYKSFMNPFSQCCMLNAQNGNPLNVNQTSGAFYIGNSNGVLNSIKPFPFWIQEYGKSGTASGVLPNSRSLPINTVMRGFVKYVASGFGHLPLGSITTINSIQYLALGGGTPLAMIIG